jgi:outer membrane protein assembly factor BamB
VTAGVLLVLGRFVAPNVLPDGTVVLVAFFAGLLSALAIIVWWAFFSRAARAERWGAVLLMIVAMAVTRGFLLHESVATGMMGAMYFFYAIPALSLVLVGWAIVSRGLAGRTRRISLVLTILIACGAWAVVRSDGITGDGAAQFAWRWAPTPEERLLADTAGAPATPPPAAPTALSPPTQQAERMPAATARETTAAAAGTTPRAAPAQPSLESSAEARPASDAGSVAAGASETRPSATAVTRRHPDWPGFRGPYRNSVVSGVRVETNWSQSPPMELWRRPIGPGWSSFAVNGDFIYTQEQRGEHEVVACYHARSGEPVWVHRDAVRFWESNGGAGPRATPTLGEDGRLYTFGATGILNALDAATGARIWSRQTTTDTGATVPYWGFSSSPLLIDDVVVVYAGALVGYDRSTGERRWLGEAKGVSYSSPHLSTIGGVPQVLQLVSDGMVSVSPIDGKVLWTHGWGGASIVQPALTDDGDVLISSGGPTGGAGIRRVSAARNPAGWQSTERWTSIGLKPYFNDFVVHKGHAYGFDGSILASLDLRDGTRKWKGGRYGHGQLVLLPDQDLLLVISEEGQLALVSATPNKYTEIARVPAIEGKTWNHPVVVRDLLLVRNGEEMVAFRLPLAGK